MMDYINELESYEIGCQLCGDCGFYSDLQGEVIECPCGILYDPNSNN